MGQQPKESSKTNDEPERCSSISGCPSSECSPRMQELEGLPEDLTWGMISLNRRGRAA